MGLLDAIAVGAFHLGGVGVGRHIELGEGGRHGIASTHAGGSSDPVGGAAGSANATVGPSGPPGPAARRPLGFDHVEGEPPAEPAAGHLVFTENGVDALSQSLK